MKNKIEIDGIIKDINNNEITDVKSISIAKIQKARKCIKKETKIRISYCRKFLRAI